MMRAAIRLTSNRRYCVQVEGCGDMGHCPNQFCANRTAHTAHARHTSTGVGAADDEGGSGQGSRGGAGAGGGPDDIRADYSTLVWIYVWPNTDYSTTGQRSVSQHASTAPHERTLTSRLAELTELRSDGLISEQEYTLGRRAALLGTSGL